MLRPDYGYAHDHRRHSNQCVYQRIGWDLVGVCSGRGARGAGVAGAASDAHCGQTVAGHRLALWYGTP